MKLLPQSLQSIFFLNVRTYLTRDFSAILGSNLVHLRCVPFHFHGSFFLRLPRQTFRWHLRHGHVIHYVLLLTYSDHLLLCNTSSSAISLQSALHGHFALISFALFFSKALRLRRRGPACEASSHVKVRRVRTPTQKKQRHTSSHSFLSERAKLLCHLWNGGFPAQH